MQGQVAVVTGASAGIGRATAIEFGRHGWRVALLARGEEGLQAACEEVRQAGGEALPLVVDVADEAQVQAAASQVEEQFGAIEVWVNNAMATVFCPALDVKPQDFRRATEVTYLGAVWGTMAALQRMKPRKRGSIVQVGSALAYRSIPLQAAYCGAKSALRGYTDSLRSELIHDGCDVHLCMVHLSAFNTPQFDWARSCMPKQPKPLGKIFQPEVAARAIYWAATHRRRELWVGMPAAEAILGNRFIAGVLDHELAHQAYAGQQDKEAVTADRQDNLYQPVAGKHSTHGRFDAQAIDSSMELWLALHRGKLAAALGVGAVLAGWAAWRRR